MGQWHRQQREAFELFCFLYVEEPSNVKTDFMPLMCFRKKTNPRRRPSMKNSDSFSARRITVARVICFWCMKSSPCPTAQQFLRQVSHGFPSSSYVHIYAFCPLQESLLSYLFSFVGSRTLFSVLQDLWYYPTVCLSMLLCWNKGWHSEMAILEVKLVVPRNLFPSA